MAVDFVNNNPFAKKMPTVPTAAGIEIYQDTSRAVEVVTLDKLMRQGEMAKESILLEPHREHIFVDLMDRLSLLSVEEKQKMRLNLGKCELIAFALEPGDENWNRLSPAGANQALMSGNKVCFALKIKDDLLTKSSFVEDTGLYHYISKTDFDPRFYVMMVESTKVNTELSRAGKSQNKITSAGAPKDELSKLIEGCFADQENTLTFKIGTGIDSYGNVVNWDRWSDSGQTYLLPAGIRLNQNVLVAIDGKSIPKWYRDREMVRDVFKRDGMKLIETLVQNKVFDKVVANSGKSIIDTLRIVLGEIRENTRLESQDMRGSKITRLVNISEFGYDDKDVKLSTLLGDQMTDCLRFLVGPNYQTEFNGYVVKAIFLKNTHGIYDDLGRLKQIFGGISIVYKDAPGVEIILGESSPPSLQNVDQVVRKLNDVANIRIGSIFFRSTIEIPPMELSKKQ